MSGTKQMAMWHHIPEEWRPW